MKRFPSSHYGVPRTLLPLQFRDEMHVLFTVQNLCKGPSAVMYREVFSYHPSGPHPHRPMMNLCLLAKAKCFYGLQNCERRVLQDGMRQYGRGLSMLRNALGKDNCNVTTEVIVSAFALSVVEVFILPFTNWLGVE